MKLPVLFTLFVCFFSFPLFADDWIQFENPDNEVLMREQIYQAALKKAKAWELTKYNATGTLENNFLVENRAMEQEWNRKQKLLLADYQDKIQQYRSTIIKEKDRKAATKSLKAKKVLLAEYDLELKKHEQSLQKMLADISHSLLVIGAIKNNGKSRDKIAGAIIPLMGQETVREINEIKIRSLTQVKNNQVILDKIVMTQKGKYQTGVVYPRNLDQFDEETMRTRQIFVQNFLVFPFSTMKKEGTTLSETVESEIHVLTDRNLQTVLKRFGKQNNQPLREWILDRLSGNRQNNKNIDSEIKMLHQRWNKQRIRMRQERDKVDRDIKLMEAQLRKNKNVDLKLVVNELNKAERLYEQHLSKRTKQSYKKESRKTTGDIKEFAELARDLFKIENEAGAYQETMVVFDQQLTRQETQTIQYKNHPKAFKILYLSRHQPGDQSENVVALAYQIQLLPNSVSMPGSDYIDLNTGIEFVTVRGGCFQMGSPENENERVKDEPLHRTCVDDFQMAKKEITRTEFAYFMAETGYKTEAEISTGCYIWDGKEWGPKKDKNWESPGFKQEETHPVTCITWNDAMEYIRWLNQKGESRYRLPTEAEWEYAARAGTKTARYWGDDRRVSDGCEYANVAGAPYWIGYECVDGYQNSSPVGSFKPNDFGLYDMIGNVWEWTADYYDKDYYRTNSAMQPNPKGPEKGDASKNRVFRGGSWMSSTQRLRAANRGYIPETLAAFDVGFRLVRIISKEAKQTAKKQ